MNAFIPYWKFTYRVSLSPREVCLALGDFMMKESLDKMPPATAPLGGKLHGYISDDGFDFILLTRSRRRWSDYQGYLSPEDSIKLQHLEGSIVPEIAATLIVAKVKPYASVWWLAGLFVFVLVSILAAMITGNGSQGASIAGVLTVLGIAGVLYGSMYSDRSTFKKFLDHVLGAENRVQ